MYLLLLLMAIHFFVDLVATVLTPLWPVLKTHTSGSEWALFTLLLGWNVTTSFAQLVFGLWGDQRRILWVVWAGPAIAAISLAVVGYFDTTWTLALLTIFAGLGIAAFHPEAASLAGNCLPGERSRAMSLFQFSGFLGQTVGPFYSGLIVDRWGLTGLFPGLAWLVIAAALVSVPLQRMSVKRSAVAPTPMRLSELFAGRYRSLFALLAIGVSRTVPATGIPLALAFLLSSRSASSTDVGILQSTFLFGVGGGGLLCALRVRPRSEWLTLFLLPVLAAPVILVLPVVRGPLLYVCAGTAGLLLGTALPVFISLGQQLLPNSQRVGSAITMGISWGIGGGLVAIITPGLERLDRIGYAFPLFAVSAVLSSLLCLGLPSVTHDESGTTNDTGEHALMPVSEP